MNQAQKRAVDAFSASPAIRLRHRILCAKAASAPPLAPVPPAVGGETPTIASHPTSAYASAQGDPQAVLMGLREYVADEIDRLLEFLDATEGDADLEPDLGYYNAKHHALDAEADEEEGEASLCGLSVDSRFAIGEGQWTADREIQCEDEGAACDDEGYPDSGLGDLDGLMEQWPQFFPHTVARVEA